MGVAIKTDKDCAGAAYRAASSCNAAQLPHFLIITNIIIYTAHDTGATNEQQTVSLLILINAELPILCTVYTSRVGPPANAEVT